MAEDSEKAREMLLRLSELLRYSLEAGLKEKVSLREELQVVQACLELEKLQFETRLKWQIEANVESRQAMVPPMFVQQLVENAVKHGISQQAEGGEISVNASLRDGRLEVKVENTGRLAEPLGRGFGIANARDRLQLLCGGGWGGEELYARLLRSRTSACSEDTELPGRLDPAVFFRASRRHIVNLQWVNDVTPAVSEGLQLTLKGGQEVKVSRRQAQLFREVMSL